MTLWSLRPTILFYYWIIGTDIVVSSQTLLSSQLLCLTVSPYYCIVVITVKQAFGNHGLLAGCDVKPIEASLGHDSVVLENDAMENNRNVDEIESSDARLARLERMNQQLPPSPLPSLLVKPNNNDDIIALTEKFNKMKLPTFQGGLKPLKAEAWILETEKLFKVFPCSEAQKVGKAMVDAHFGQQWFYDLGSIQGDIL
ncbi:hypothetical protein CsSME_00031620 [Camellia sinensis var. sinensis]